MSAGKITAGCFYLENHCPVCKRPRSKGRHDKCSKIMQKRYFEEHAKCQPTDSTN